nr:MAG TPA: nucleoside triphosphate pyrophosphohydrolase [Caudoviricetes sp.]
MMLHDNAICQAALETFGKELQVTMAIEEMSELTKELCKRCRGRDNVEAFAEEIADVEIMLQQMVMLFDCAGQVETFRRYKLERLAGRIEEAKEEKHGTTDV